MYTVYDRIFGDFAAKITYVRHLYDYGHFSLPKQRMYAIYIYMILAIFKHMGWPEACLYTVYDRILCDFPTKNTVYLLSMYGSGQR